MRSRQPRKRHITLHSSATSSLHTVYTWEPQAVLVLFTPTSSVRSRLGFSPPPLSRWIFLAPSDRTITCGEHRLKTETCKRLDDSLDKSLWTAKTGFEKKYNENFIFIELCMLNFLSLRIHHENLLFLELHVLRVQYSGLVFVLPPLLTPIVLTPPFVLWSSLYKVRFH